jgi:hypothetical protein
MPVLPFNNSPFKIFIPNRGGVRFIPHGPFLYPLAGATRMNPFARLLKYGPNFAARMFVGLSVGKKGVYTVQDVVSKVRDFLKVNEWAEDSTFIAQRGVFTENKGEKNECVVPEKSVQVVVFKQDSGPEVKFKPLMKKLALHLCRDMRQKSVILDYQRNGVTKELWDVTP